MKRHLSVLLVAAATIGLATAGRTEEPAALAEKVIAAYGGAEELGAGKAYRIGGTILTGHSRPPAPFHRILVRPDKLEVYLDYTDGAEQRVLAGEKGWRGSKQGLVAVTGPLLDSMALQLARSDIPWIFLDRKADLTACKAGRQLGQELPCLGVGLGEGLRLEAYLDPQSHRVLRAITYLDHGPMVMNFDTRFSDFREVDGVLFAFKEENYAGGTHTAATALATVKLNPTIAADTFPE